MSLKHRLMNWALGGLGLGALAAVIVGAVPVVETPSPKMPFRPASQRPMAAKAHQSLEVQIQNLNDLPENPGEKLTLEVTLKTNRILDGAAQYRWSLPDDVRLEEGELGIQSANLVPGEPVVFNVKVSGVSLQTPQILRLDLVAFSDGESLAAQGFFSSHPTQIDLSRRALRPRGNLTPFQKTSTGTTDGVRLPAGIHF